GTGGEPVAATGTGFRLDTLPSGATVFVDDRQRSTTTPVTVTDLTPGMHTIRTELTNYAPWTGQIDVQANEIEALPRTVLPLRQVTVRFVSRPEGARVALVRGDGRRSVGETPTPAQVDVSGGAWTVEMSRSGHEDWSAPLAPPPGQAEHTVTATLVERERVATGRHTPRRTPDREPSGPVRVEE